MHIQACKARAYRYFTGAGRALISFSALKQPPGSQSVVADLLNTCSEADALPLENKLFFAVGCGISILGISLLIFKRRALKAAALGADVPLFSPPVGPQAEYSMASHSLDSMVVIGDPTAALVSDITEEYQNAKSEYRRVSDASERSGIAMHSSFYGSTDTGRLRADSKNSHISTMP